VSLSRNDPQKVALEKNLQVLEDAFREKWGEGAKAVSSWSAGGKHLDQLFWSIGVSSVSLSLSLANG
jgi:hypothetical protein